MSVARPARCLLSKRFAAAVNPSCHAAPFHSSAQLASRRKPRFKSIRAAEMGLVTPEKVEEYTKTMFPSYSPEEMEILRKRYTPEQMAALEAGEAAIDPKDLTIQGRLRTDPYNLPYLDDFSRSYPGIDKRVKTAPPPDPTAKFMNEDEHTEDFVKWSQELVPPHLKHLLESETLPEEGAEKQLKKMTMGEYQKSIDSAASKQLATQERQRLEPLIRHLEKVVPLESLKYFTERSTMTDKNAGSNSSLAPHLAQARKGGQLKRNFDPDYDEEDELGQFLEVKRRTGMTVREITAIRPTIVAQRFISNQTRLGRVERIWYMAIAGNQNGRLGIGVAKAVEPSVANTKAKIKAIQNMKPITRYENRTIYGSVKAKVGATVVQIDTRPPGFGLRASHRLFEIFRAAGIHDVSAKMPRRRNPMNTVYACVKALQSQKDPEQIAMGRGKKLVDVRQVYFGGNVE